MGFKNWKGSIDLFLVKNFFYIFLFFKKKLNFFLCIFIKIQKRNFLHNNENVCD